ncbi:ataxin-7-like protein 2 [Amia ocellicauda]|uniref:ataxin-7-like protein 2 n=1 Tax=Amia ocellicauda TaxID=2972642 RepID=UPI0034649D41
MMAVRERAAAVMAALDRRVPSLEDFAGQSWSSWVERADIPAADGLDVEEGGKNGRKKVEAMTLRTEDMSIFGLCPAHDDFFLVVCSHCSQVVKPQAFEKHCERRHGPLSKLYSHLHPSPSAPLPRLRPGHPPAYHGTSRAGRDRPQGVTPPRTPLQPPPQRSAKGQKDGGGSPFAPAVNVEKAPPQLPSDSPNVKLPAPPVPPPAPCSPGPRDPPSVGSPLSRTTQGTPPSERALSRRGEVSRTPETPRSGHKTYKKVSKKECDLDKHCGVLDPDRKKLCTRLLTCNIHSVHQRRKVTGRTKNFDQLVAELKTGASRGRERGAPSRDRSGPPSPDTTTPPGDPSAAPSCRRRLPNCTALRSGTSSDSGGEGEGTEPDAEPLCPPEHERLSSEEEEEEEEEEGAEETNDCHCTPWHPQPLGLCSFGSHAVGRGVFTFDRRLHHLRAALSSMVERHLSAHLWKKIPQAKDLQSQRTSAATPASSSSPSSFQHSSSAASLPSASSLRPSSSCVMSSALAKDARLQPCPAASPGPGTSNVGGGGQSITSPLPANTPSPSPSGPGRTPTPAAKLGKPCRLKEGAGLEHSAASRKRKKPPSLCSEGPSGPDRSRAPPERAGRTPVSPPTEPLRIAPAPSQTPSPHGPLNGTLSPGNKPRPPPPPSPRPLPPPDPGSRGRPGGGQPGLRCKTVGYDHGGLGKKRKSAGPPAPPPRPSKPHRAAPPAHSSFFSWKKDVKGAALPAGLGRKLSTQKPKLHH